MLVVELAHLANLYCDVLPDEEMTINGKTNKHSGQN